MAMDYSVAELDQNPLVNLPELPMGVAPWDRLKDEHFLPAIRYGIQRAEERIELICSNSEAPTFANTIEAFEGISEELDLSYESFSLICDVNSTDALREIEEVVDVEVTRFTSAIFLNERLFARVKAVYDERERLALTPEQSMLLKNRFRSFVRHGANLPSEGKTRLKEIDQELSSLTTKFDTNRLKATGAYRRIVTEAELEGVPERAKNIFRDQAAKAGLPEGSYCLLLAPFPQEIFTHATNRALREEVSLARATLGCSGEYDNTGIAMDIVRLRHERAQLLGYDTYADFVLAERMAGSVDTVNAFLEKNLAVYKPAAEADLKEIRDYALHVDGLDDLKPWDLAYYERRMAEERFDLDTEALRPYFDMEKVLVGLFQHAEKLFNITITEEKTGKYPVHHEDARTFEVFDNATGAQLGLFIGDYYARPGSKRSGAWCSQFRGRGRINGEDRLPIIFNFCNFSRPTPEQPALLSLEDVRTLPHEFGHALHGLLAEGDYASLTGHNVKWDFVELPSQLMENWITEPSVLSSFAHHYQTGEAIPVQLIQKVEEAKNFHIGRVGLGQTFYGLLDMAYYGAVPDAGASIDGIEARINARARVIEPGRGLVSPSFSHIFSGGYAAGYYSYKWAEGMEADIFAAFKESGLYDPTLSARLRETIFSKGGSVDPMELYARMMGREPDPDALFRREGLLANPPAVERVQASPAPILH